MSVFISNAAYGQIIREGDFGLDAPVKYSATDSIVVDLKSQIIRLYGNADVKYQEVHLTADLIEIDIEKSEVQATYTLDSLGNAVGKPAFTDGTENVTCDGMKYNFKSEKAIIQEVRTQQGEGYIHMETSKRQPNEEIHFKNGKYTTCSNEKPHYHFQLSKAIAIPDKRIVAGPLYMRILNVPLPIAAPFAILPNSEKKKHGIEMPSFALAGPFGTGFENLRYYIPLGSRWETYINTTLFTTGRWAISNSYNYNVKYKHSGTFRVGFAHLSGYFFDKAVTNNFTLFWNHNQAAKAHPSLKFSANIDFRSNNNAAESIEIIPVDQFNTNFNSAVTLNKAWKLKDLRGAWTGKVSLQQNSQTNNFVFELPSFNFSVNRFDLGVLRKSSVGKKWYENIFINYNLTSLNRVTVADSIARTSFSAGDLSFLSDNNSSGIRQNAIIQTNLQPKSGWFTFNLRTTYQENWNFQTYNKEWNTITDTTDITEINGFAANRNINFSGGLSTNIYGYYKSNFKNKIKLRHVMSPNISFTYRPDLGNHQEIIIDTAGNTGYYSPFDVSLYREAARGESGTIDFNLGNTLEMKRIKKSDTINQTFTNVKIIDRFNISGNYDILADSLNLSDIRFSFQTSPFKTVSLQSSWTLSPYQWNANTRTFTNEYALKTNQGVGHIRSANFTVSSRHSIKPEKSDSLRNFKNSTWNFSVIYNLNYSRKTSSGFNDTTTSNFRTPEHTVGISGSANLWKLWGLNYNVLTDVIGVYQYFKNPTNLDFAPNPSMAIGITRQLHCWEASLNFTKNGNFFRQIFADGSSIPSYVIRFKINIKASMFDAFLPEVRPRVDFLLE
ncbi:MAG: putative LPS assembly protein LptD [Crocinitomicaceae bacterium]